MYKEYKGLNLPEIDKDIQKFWDTEGVFEKSVQQRDPNNAFVFYEGPPSANGLPGIHHVMARTIKDIFCRFQTLNGKRVERKGGWDTHGLPIELAVEKELGITKEDIGKKISVDDYNHKCREVVMRYKDLWDDITRKMGYWVDLDNPYVTYENAYIETVWFLLKRLYEKDYLYKGYTIQPFSPAAGTGLSSHELNMPGAYKDIRDTSITAQFEIENALKLPSELFKNAVYTEGSLQTSNVELQTKNTEGSLKSYFLAWTTTPWTLPSNCALVVGGKLDYAAVESFNSYTGQRGIFILAKALIAKNFDPKGENGDFDAYKLGDKQIPWRLLGECKGADLEGVKYHQLMPYVAPNGEKAFEVLLGDFVTTEDGTGIVHTAALFGADDFRITKATGTAFITVRDEQDKEVPLVNKLGRFVKEVTDFAGEYVKEQYLTEDEKEAERERLGLKKYLSVDERISIKLKTENKAFKVEKYNHNYPHCWRTDKPILYYPLDSWFIAASKAKERMFELNKTINWKPAATGEGRFGKWLENLQDWNLSRSRYWGIGLPIWRTEIVEGKEMHEKCIGSIAELQFEINRANDILNLNQTVPADLHRPYIDDIILVTTDGRPMKRELDLIDVWFDSGSMPYAQWGLDNAKLIAGDEQPFNAPFNVSYPADFIAEGVDQTRGWFYTLHAIAVMAYDSVAFKNVMSNGLVQDKNGQKMSKSKGNAVDPFLTIAKYGADATRWYLISNAQPWDNLKFDEDGITETRNKFFGTLYNSYNFFAMYANVDGFVQDEMNQTPMENRIELDKWILSRLHSLVGEVTELYATYEPTLAARAIEKFVDADFSNWYVRLSRRRFWKGEMSDDKKSAYETMYECLMVVSQLSAPIAPYFSDWMYKNLTDDIRSKATANNTPLRHPSVHLTDLTKSDNNLIDKDLEQRMDYAQRISSLILSLRKKEKIRVRQPLSRVLLPIVDATFIGQVEKAKDLILSETNVKAFEYITDASGVVTKKIKPNFKTLGKALGGNMKFAQPAIEALTQADIAQIETNKTINLTLNGQTYPLSIDDFLITSEDIPGWLVANDGDVTVALDVTLTDELIAEGTARDLVNKIQNLRKDRDFNITDKIKVKLERHEAIIDAVNNYSDYIKSEVLATEFVFADMDFADKIELNDTIGLGIEVCLN
jgi:isoleucyl-tRNA synthetase